MRSLGRLIPENIMCSTTEEQFHIKTRKKRDIKKMTHPFLFVCLFVDDIYFGDYDARVETECYLFSLIVVTDVLLQSQKYGASRDPSRIPVFIIIIIIITQIRAYVPLQRSLSSETALKKKKRGASYVLSDNMKRDIIVFVLFIFIILPFLFRLLKFTIQGEQMNRKKKLKVEASFSLETPREILILILQEKEKTIFIVLFDVLSVLNRKYTDKGYERERKVLFLSIGFADGKIFNKIKGTKRGSVLFLFYLMSCEVLKAERKLLGPYNWYLTNPTTEKKQQKKSPWEWRCRREGTGHEMEIMERIATSAATLVSVIVVVYVIGINGLCFIHSVDLSLSLYVYMCIFFGDIMWLEVCNLAAPCEVPSAAPIAHLLIYIYIYIYILEGTLLPLSFFKG
eukprot:gene10585-7353_t